MCSQIRDSQKRNLVAVDCDGTFFGSDGHPSQITKDVVLRFVAAGHAIVAATGRSRFTACGRLEGVAGLRYIICSNGAYAWDLQNKQLIWDTEIPNPVAIDLVGQLRAVMPDVALAFILRSR